MHGWIVTGNAGLAHQPVAEAVLQQGGDYVLTVKGNQPTWQEDIALLFSDPAVVADTIPRATQATLHGGRIERRTLAASAALVGYSERPALAQVVQLERQATPKKTPMTTREVVYGVTSLPPEAADAGRLLILTRGPWGIENRLRWVRDATFGEDKSRVRSGHAPQVMAALRNIALSLLRTAGFTCIAAALRHLAAHPQKAIRFVSLSPPKLSSARMK